MKTRQGARVSRKVDLLGESVIKEMTSLANRYGAINLAQGFPDFSAPEPVKSAAVKAINDGYNQYEITYGSVALRRAISEKLLEFNGIRADPDEGITVTCGSSEAMMDAVVALTDHGDEVIVPEPFYENYVPATVISGADARHVRMREPAYRFDEEELKRAFTDRTRLMILNSPNNPTGRVLARDELKLVADLCEDYDVLAVSDEIYERIVYEGHSHLSLATVGNMLERTVTISGISKTFSVTGWRVGYAVAPKHLTPAIRKVHDFTTVCAPAAFQQAAAEALTLPASYYEGLAKGYSAKREFMLKSLAEIGFRCVEPQGAYYILADFREFSDKDDGDFARYLTKEARVAVLPGSSFYANGGAGRNVVRFSFCKRDETLSDAVERLRRTLA